MVDTAPLVDDYEKEKKIGHKFCGCCCDSRRAVIIVNFIDFIFVLIAILLAVATNDDIGAGWAVLIIDIIIVALTIAGAALYNKWLVILGCLWAVINLTLRIVAATQGLSYFAVTVNGEVIRLPWLEVILAFIWEGLILYADITFIVEVSKGIMSRDTYKKREEQSCCCV
ncbi:hypothetical protein ACHAWC_007362 [Mediolabrus comicus]